MINFKLADIDNVTPAGTENDLKMSWFWLTEADLWLTFGETTIYEYTKEALEYFGTKSSAYNDYPLIRFIEDFTEIFNQISGNVPEKFYLLTKDLFLFLDKAEKWLAIYDTDEDEYSDFYFEEYDKLISWVYKRSFDAMHLKGGPSLSFFRNNSKIRIIWYTEHTLENGINLWTAKNGAYEMDYADFISKIKDFGVKFFEAMDNQVDLAIKRDWGNVQIDKIGLVEEHSKRKTDFYNQLVLLEQESTKKTNWEEVERLLSRMYDETK
jgi:hypothetical protein